MGEENLFARQLNQDSTLQEALETLTVPQLQGILFYMHLQETAVAEKEMLVQTICRGLPHRAKCYAQCFDMERYLLFQMALQAEGVIVPVELEVRKMVTLLELGLAYPAMCEDKQVLVVPKEIRTALSELEPADWEMAAQYNTHLLQQIYGMLYYYGYLDTETLFRFCMHKEAEDAFENVYFMEVLYTAVLYYGQVEPEENGFRHKYFLYYSHVREQQEQMTMLPEYKVFPEAVLERAGQPEYMEWTLEMERLKRFLTKQGHMPAPMAKHEVEILWYDYNNGMSVAVVGDYFTERYFSCSPAALQEELQTLLFQMYYTMPLWLLRGHSFAELADVADLNEKEETEEME